MGLSITPIHCGVLSNVERSSQQYLVGCGERIDVPLIMWLILLCAFSSALILLMFWENPRR